MRWNTISRKPKQENKTTGRRKVQGEKIKATKKKWNSIKEADKSNTKRQGKKTWNKKTNAETSKWRPKWEKHNQQKSKWWKNLRKSNRIWRRTRRRKLKVN
ncbi:hypothetical protein HYD82_03995 [Mycoplasmopsis bovis]|nr:hypothetical protein [Mycoplasmopsis bovis]QQH37675.1 hypothetical protein HYD82_03995 [Mycoplasmopsis bovis]